MKLIPACFYLLYSLLLFSCSQEKEIYDDRDINPELLKAYIPLKVGKYITYRLDSTVFTQLGRGEEVHSYQEKHVIQGFLTDNLGDTTFRVFRYIRDLAGLKDWTQNGTYFIKPPAYKNIPVNNNSKVEVIENNQRVISLIVPIREGITWKGNSYLPSDSYISTGFSDIDKWDFTIKRTDETLAISNEKFRNVITVERINEQYVPDTIVVTDNKATIPANVSAALVIGSPTKDTVIISAIPPSNSYLNLTVYNRTDKALSLNKIIIPAKKTRSYEYENSAWVFGSRDSLGRRLDSVLSDLPNGTRGYVVDKYEKNIGLIYSEFVLWTSNPSYVDGTTYKIGTSIRREIIEHN